MKKDNIVIILSGCLIVSVIINIITITTFVNRGLGKPTLAEEQRNKKDDKNDKIKKGLVKLGELNDVNVLKGKETLSVGDKWSGVNCDLKVTNVTQKDQIFSQINNNTTVKAPGKYIIIETTIVNKTNEPYQMGSDSGILYSEDKYYTLNYDLSSIYNKEENFQQGPSVIIPNIIMNGQPADMLNPGVEYKYYSVYDVPKGTLLKDLQVGVNSVEANGFINIWKCE